MFAGTLDSLHRTYCMHMYGCELWDLNRNYVKDFKVAWRKIKRRIWKLPYRTHNAIVHNLSYNIDFIYIGRFYCRKSSKSRT